MANLVEQSMVSKERCLKYTKIESENPSILYIKEKFKKK